ncbi:ion channel [Marinoscillum sp. MHG1-6]|uniref:ion channel n=1 Tax=Marinoscillum sp. MHG1-6 TaxID=2959627 RepID=UPI0021575D96|nr:ion channel [Marinoscillum sp. MHG1-6]
MAKKNTPRKNFSDRFRELGLGIGRTTSGKLIDKEGHFNVIRKGIGIHGFSLYHWLINLSWIRFFVFVLLSYILVNLLFAVLYWMIGAEHLTELDATNMHPFWHCFYFSSQTLTTVGYGRISPVGELASMVAAFEAMIGLLGFAFATGILYGRFSKAKSKIIFSDRILVSPYQGIKGLKFRIANTRRNELIEMEARLMYSFLHEENGEFKRRYMSLDLEISFINMFPLPWTIVHPIGDESPIQGKTAEDFSRERAEFLVILKGYDETFNQYVHQIHDYDFDEVVFDANFKPMFDPAAGAGTVVHLDKISDFIKL